MFRRCLGLCAILTGLTSLSLADTVYLKDGRRIQGEIVEQNNYSTRMTVDGHAQVFYSGQIDHIVEDEKMGQDINVDAGSFNNISKEKADLIIELLKVNGLTATLQKSIETTIQNAPENRRDEFMMLFKFDELVKILVPIFDVYYSEDDLKELIKIYKNPVRQKEIENNSALVKEALEKMIRHIYEKTQP
jgi:sRNA-binding regulator protein Hfq